MKHFSVLCVFYSFLGGGRYLNDVNLLKLSLIIRRERLKV
jgi:hypothetical protein